MAGKISNIKAPEQTFEEVHYLKRLIDDRVPVRVELTRKDLQAQTRTGYYGDESR